MIDLPWPLILASSSPRRKELLREAGFEFGIVPSEVEEIQDSNSASELTTTNAGLKARDIARRHPDSLIIGSDTIVWLDAPLGKPADIAEAKSMLQSLSGRTHVVCTGVALVHHSSSREKTFSVETEVTFKPLTETTIVNYLNLIEPLDKAGAYAAQDFGDMIIKKIDGSRSNVIGLPMESLGDALEEFANSRL